MIAALALWFAWSAIAVGALFFLDATVGDWWRQSRERARTRASWYRREDR